MPLWRYGITSRLLKAEYDIWGRYWPHVLVLIAMLMSLCFYYPLVMIARREWLHSCRDWLLKGREHQMWGLSLQQLTYATGITAVST